MIALGGKDVAEEQLVDILWPDADGDLAHKSFEMTVQRLRRLIGSDEAVQLQDRRLSLDLSLCWIDVRELEGLIETIDAAWKSGEPSNDNGRGIRLSEKALALYKGHFLPADSSQPWVLSTRERLRSKFLRLIIRVGGHWEQHLQWQKAAKSSKRASRWTALQKSSISISCGAITRWASAPKQCPSTTAAAPFCTRRSASLPPAKPKISISRS